MLRRKGLVAGCLAAMFIAAGSARAQKLGEEALNSFPAGTAQIQYTSPEELRNLPDYNALRARYMGPWLKGLETSLAELGISESDVNNLVLGWTTTGSQQQLYGLASGHFDSRALAKRAAERGIAPVAIGGKAGYCLGAGVNTACVVVLSPSLGAFGTLNTVSELMDVRNGARPKLALDAKLASLVSQVENQSPIWGIATHGSVAAWFQNWMPRQNTIQLDWGQVFQNVDTLSYKVNAGSSVDLNVTLECNSVESAQSLDQVLEGLKLAQQLAWQSQNPTVGNPFSGMSVNLAGSEIDIQLKASYGQLSAVGSGGGASTQP